MHFRPRTDRTILHIDMNSYFASVAQQANPFLKGKPIGIGGKPGTRGIIAAASREAKLRGVKTAMNAYQALKICPELEIIHGDPTAYEDITNRFLAIFRRYTDTVEVFSIDEAFLDVTKWHQRWGGAENLAAHIKEDMRREIGEMITCSVGIAPNKMLAKLASDFQKPNGLVRITHKNVFLFYFLSELSDIYGIGPRTAKHLKRLGIHSLLELHTTPLTRLTTACGRVTGTHLWLIGQGEDPSPVVALQEAQKSFGNSYTLPKDSTDIALLEQTLFALTEKACRRMRAEAFRTASVSATIRFGDLRYTQFATKMPEATADPAVIMRHLLPRIEPLLTQEPVRLLGVSLSDLVQDRTQDSFLTDKITRRDRLLVAVDAIQNRYGSNAIHSAQTTNVVLKRHVSGFAHGSTINIERRQNS